MATDPIADTAGQVNKCFVRSFLARWFAGGKSNFAHLLFQQLELWIKIGAGMSVRSTMRRASFGIPVIVASVAASVHIAVAVAAETPALSCPGATTPHQVAELSFGRDIGHSIGVSEQAWARFVARELSPRFSDGLTITDAVGQWRNPTSGRTVQEPTKQVEIVLPGKDDDEARLEAVVAAYKHDFSQHSVVVIVRTACVSF
jgi:hypothetical protein